MTATPATAPDAHDVAAAPDVAGAPPAPGTPDRPRHDLPLLEAYRGVAALLVVLTHVGFASGAALQGRWAGPLARLDFGVTVFFLLSGFLLFRPWVQHAYLGARPVRVRAYLWRRAVRLLPAYAAVLAGTALLVPQAREAAARTWVETALLVHVYTGDPALPGLSQTWSLATEVSFYVALPVLAVLVLGRRRGPDRTPGRLRPLLVLAGLAVASVVYRGWSAAQDPYTPVLTWLPANLDWFAAGMALAVLSAAPAFAGLRAAAAHAVRSPGAWFAGAVAVFWLVATPLGGPYGLSPGTPAEVVVKHVAYLVAATALLVPAVFDTRPVTGGWRAVALSGPARWLGRVSYGLFLWHLPVLEGVRAAAGHEPFTGGFWWLLAATLAGGLLLAELSWRLVESPAQRLRRLVR